jgi:hypothetical protein
MCVGGHAGCRIAATYSHPSRQPLTGDLQAARSYQALLNMQADRLLVFSDANCDLYVAAAAAPAPVKLAASVASYRWADTCDVLAAASDGHLLLWYCPAAALGARELLGLTRVRRAVAWGPAPTLDGFSGSLVCARQRNGARKAATANPGALHLHALVQAGRCASRLGRARRMQHERDSHACPTRFLDHSSQDLRTRCRCQHAVLQAALTLGAMQVECGAAALALPRREASVGSARRARAESHAAGGRRRCVCLH